MMADSEGEAPKKVKGINLGKLAGDESAAGRLRKQMDALTGGTRAISAALGPTSAFQETLGFHRSAIDATRILPNVSAVVGLADAARMTDAYRFPEIAGIGAFDKVRRSLDVSFGVGSLAEMVGTQSALAAFGPSLDFLKNDTVTRALEDVSAQQSMLGSAIGAYMDQHRAQAERITGMVAALAMPSVDLDLLGIGSALAFRETNAFKFAGLTSDYADQFHAITGAVNERVSAFAGFGSAVEAFALQPDLVGGIGLLLERALAQQKTLLEQHRQVVEHAADVEPRGQTIFAERLAIIAAIVTILQFCILIALQVEARMIGGDPATLENTAAIEQNTRTIGQMRGSFDALADQLDMMRAMQGEAGEEDRAANAAIADILREIADTLASQSVGDDEAP